MNRRYILCLLLALTPLAVNAQFIGDTMAAAGFAETEDQAPGIAAIVSGRMPRESAMPVDPSHPQPSATPSEASLPRPSGTVPPELRPGVPQVTSVTGQGTMPPPPPLPPGGLPPGSGQTGGYIIGGSGTTYTAEETADWKASFRPVGATVVTLPAGSESINAGGSSYAYSKGVFYQQQGSQWVVVPAPIGARVKERPAAASLISYHGGSYFYYNGAFFAWNSSENAAFVVKPPAGITVTYVPETATQETRDGQKVYVYGGNTFRPAFRGMTLIYQAL